MIEGLNKALELLDAEIKKAKESCITFPDFELGYQIMGLEAGKNAILVEIAMIEDAERVKPK